MKGRRLTRMTKGTRLRRIAKRALPVRLLASRRAAYQADLARKRPRPPRQLQREIRQAQREALKQHLAEQRERHDVIAETYRQLTEAPDGQEANKAV